MNQAADHLINSVQEKFRERHIAPAHIYGKGSWVLRSWGSSSEVEGFRQFGYSKHLSHALEVICHCRETDFDLCTAQSAHQETRVSKDLVLDRRKGVLYGLLD
jgi:hypothetical protein